MCYSLFFMQKYLLALWTTILLNEVAILTKVYFVIRDDHNYTYKVKLMEFKTCQTLLLNGTVLPFASIITAYINTGCLYWICDFWKVSVCVFFVMLAVPSTSRYSLPRHLFSPSCTILRNAYSIPHSHTPPAHRTLRHRSMPCLPFGSQIIACDHNQACSPAHAIHCRME